MFQGPLFFFGCASIDLSIRKLGLTNFNQIMLSRLPSRKMGFLFWKWKVSFEDNAFLYFFLLYFSLFILAYKSFFFKKKI